MKKKILFVRTYKTLKAGGPVPPLGVLHIASAVMNAFNDAYRIKICHLGVNGFSLYDIEKEIKDFSPDIVGVSALTCEFDLAQIVAEKAKSYDHKITVVIGGPHASLLKGNILKDNVFDIVVIGEGERTFIDLLRVLEEESDLSRVKGICYKKAGEIFTNSPQPYIENLNDFTVSSRAWNLINLRQYSGYQNWNGVNREKVYAPIVTSRGCPFSCSFCRSRDIFGQSFRTRSSENVFQEISDLFHAANVREIHFFDDVFNFDAERVKQICSYIIKSKMKISLAFPNGLRADLMSEELIRLLRQAGTYKINYGIETIHSRSQALINKNLKIDQVENTINQTARAGIITNGYFIVGFPGESSADVRKTIDFAVKSKLNNAYFFKLTDFSIAENSYYDESKFHFYAAEDSRTGGKMKELDMNKLILDAQQQFYLKPGRIIRNFWLSDNKFSFIKNTIESFACMLQAYLERRLIKNHN